MALDLTREKLSLNDSQLRELTSQIRQGDLTPVLQIYEQDIKTPVRTAVTGSLIRSLLIQIQKAKVPLFGCHDSYSVLVLLMSYF